MDIAIVIVGAARPGNVGAAARAMKTMGFAALRLVGEPLHEHAEARAFAHGATDVLDECTVFPSLNAALADRDYAVATTGRRRGTRTEYLTPDELRTALDGGARGTAIALVFGREESGLSNDELDQCEAVSAVPMRAPYPSLNLGQAVMVYAYALSSLMFETARPQIHQPAAGTVRSLREKVTRLLPQLGFDPGRARYRRIIERVGRATAIDAQLMHAVANAIDGKLHAADSPAPDTHLADQA